MDLCDDDFIYPGMEVDEARDQLEQLGYFDYLIESEPENLGRFA